MDAPPTASDLAVADEIDVDPNGMVATELAQQILEDVWSDGQPLDEKRPEIAKLWKQMQRDDGKVEFERFLECYYFEAKKGATIELSEDASICGSGKCPGPWFIEWEFFWALWLPLAVYLYLVFFEMTGDGLDGRPKINQWHPHKVLKMAVYGCLLAQFGMGLCAAWRAHILGGQSKGTIINGKLVQKTSIWTPFQWFLEANDEDARKEDIGQMSHIYSLMIGPFLVVTTISLCLAYVTLGLIMKGDGSGYIDPERCLDAVTGLLDTSLCSQEDYDEEVHSSCQSPLGYFGTISGVSANILPQGYVFMFITISTNALVVLTHMPEFGILQGVQENSMADLHKRQWEEGYFPNRDFNLVCFLVRFGLAMTCLTAVLPDVVEGVVKLTSTAGEGGWPPSLTQMHLGGIGLGIMSAILGITYYVVTALRLRTTNDNHAKKADQTILWVPHVLTMWVLTLTFLSVTGFVIAASSKPHYDNYHNQCLLRDPVTHLTPEGTMEPCGLPASFNKPLYRKQYPYFDFNLAATKDYTDVDPAFVVGYDFTRGARVRSVESVGPCQNIFQTKDNTDPNGVCAVVKVSGGLMEFMVDGSEMPKDCTPSNEGTICMDRDCKFHEYKVGFVFEFALLYFVMTLCQLWVYTFHFDWQIHDPLIVEELAADAPTSKSLQNRDLMILGGVDAQNKGAADGRALGGWTFAGGFAYFLLFITFWNCVKVPFYVVLFPATAVENSTTLPFGMENSVPLYYLAGYHGSKQAFDPRLFLAPHTIMGSSFFLMSAAYISGKARFEKMLSVFFPIVIVFCIHTIPCKDGLSNRLTGWPADYPETRYQRAGKFSPNAAPVNEVCLALATLCAIVGIYFNPVFGLNKGEDRPDILWWCWAITLADMCLSPFADVVFIGKAVVTGALSVEVGPEGPLPSPESGKGFYASLGCPGFLGVLIALVWIAAVSYYVTDMLVKEYNRPPNLKNEWEQKKPPTENKDGEEGTSMNPVAAEEEGEDL